MKLIEKNQQIESLEEVSYVMPKLSIVIPNFNGGKTIARSIDSLLNQNYPNLEIIIIDAGSTDRSVEIIQSYEQHLTYWISEPDNGQANAINKGFRKCSGDIVNWLCSDDILLPGTLNRVGKLFAKDSSLDVVAGGCRTIFLAEDNREFIKQPTLEKVRLMPVRNAIAQPSCFYRRKLLARPQPLDESYNYAMDFELWTYFNSLNAQWLCLDEVLSVAYQDGNNKSETGGYKVTLELERVYVTYTKEIIPLTFWHRKLRFPLEKVMSHNSDNILFYIAAFTWVIVSLFIAPFYGFKRVWTMRWKRWV